MTFGVRRVNFSRGGQDINFEHKYKMHFCGNIFSLSPTKMCIKHTLKAFNDFRNKEKSVWSNVVSYIKVFIFYKSIQYNIHSDKTQMLKKVPSEKISGTKNSLFFLLRALTHYSFTSNLLLLYKLKHKVRLSTNVCVIFHFWFRLIFIKVYIFVQQNAKTLSL